MEAAATGLETIHGPWLPAGTVTQKAARDWAQELGEVTEGGDFFSPYVATHLQQVQRLVSLANIVSSDVVCDLGCGDAGLLCELVRLTGCTAIGCDVDADALARAQARIDSEPYASRISLRHECIRTFMLGTMFQSATCVFVFLLPQQLSALSAGLHKFLIDRPERSHCVLSQRFQIGEFKGECKQISDEKCVSAPSHAGHEAADQGRPDYFGSLGAAFLYTAASCAAEAQPLTYTRDSHFSPLEREPSSGISLFRSVPRCVTFDGSSLGQVVETRVPGVEGAFVLSNILTAHECAQISGVSQAMGYLPDALRHRSVRATEQCLWVADDSLWKPIWARLARFMPLVDGLSAVGLNQRWRCYRYGRGHSFGRHHDGSWAGSGIDEEGRFVRNFWQGRRLSQMSVVFYLDNMADYEGGATTFFESTEDAVGHAVRVPQGSVLCFFHGQHPLSPLHEGSRVSRGVKRVVRTDVLYPTLQEPRAGPGESP